MRLSFIGQGYFIVATKSLITSKDILKFQYSLALGFISRYYFLLSIEIAFGYHLSFLGHIILGKFRVRGCTPKFTAIASLI